QSGFGVDHAHTATTTTARGLDDDRVAHFTGNAHDFCGIVGQGAIRTGNHRHTGLDHGFFGHDLIAHRADVLGTWADKDKTALFDTISEVRVFSHKAIARVNGF